MVPVGHEKRQEIERRRQRKAPQRNEIRAHVFFPPAATPYHSGRFFFLFFFPFGILLFFLVVFEIVRLIFRPWEWGYRRAYWRYRSEAAEIVKARYARGEITKEQFDQMMRDLEQHS